jgi:hypothetical protein
MRHYDYLPLNVYELPQPRNRSMSRRFTEKKSQIDRFRLLQKECNSPWLTPTVVLTVATGSCEAALWVESLTEPDLAFNCIKVFNV